MHYMFHFLYNLWVFFQCMLLSIFIKKASSLQSPEDQINLENKKNVRGTSTFPEQYPFAVRNSTPSCHELHIVVLCRNCVQKWIWNTILDEVAWEKKEAGERNFRNFPYITSWTARCSFTLELNSRMSLKHYSREKAKQVRGNFIPFHMHHVMSLTLQFHVGIACWNVLTHYSGESSSREKTKYVSGNFVMSRIHHVINCTVYL